MPTSKRRVNVTLSEEEFAALGRVADQISGGNKSAAIRQLIADELRRAKVLVAFADPHQLRLFAGDGGASGGGSADDGGRDGDGEGGA